MEKFPKSLREYLQAVARETARMSYPPRMSGVVVQAGAKLAVEQHFVNKFPLRLIWKDAPRVANRFDRWHKKRAQELGSTLNAGEWLKNKSNRVEAVAVKFLNTFLHQLMKYKPCRPLWKALHLTLDRKVFDQLRSLNSPALEPIEVILKKPPYSISYAQYIQIQRALSRLVAELNKRPDVEYKLTSRIELNVLWAKGGDKRLSRRGRGLNC